MKRDPQIGCMECAFLRHTVSMTAVCERCAHLRETASDWIPGGGDEPAVPELTGYVAHGIEQLHAWLHDPLEWHNHVPRRNPSYPFDHPED